MKNDPDDPTLHYNLGDALYRNKKYKEAVSAFNNGLKTEDLSLQARSYYNRGNTQFFLGAGTEKTDPEHTIKLWQQALKSYQAALALHPEDEEAAHNRNVVEKKLEQLKKQEQENQQKNKDQKKNKEKKGNKENKGDKSQQQDEQKQSQNSNRQKQQQEKGDKGKKQPEKQGDENNRKAAGNKEQKDQQQEQIKNTAGNAGQQQSNEDKTSQQDREMSKQDMARKLEGKMTREEAKNLLESLKGEQRELNFIPQGSGFPDNEGRDW